MLLDRARVRVKAGDGGKGAISFRREAHVPRGGPDGGDGGRGGDVRLRADPQVIDLSDFRYRKVQRAASGGNGTGSDRTGRSADHLVLRVPVGTIVRDTRTQETVADLVEAGQEVRIARGGEGGRGNARFASSTRQVPRIAEDGQPGEERDLELELKLIADVGLIGLPNAGKSSLLGALTRARPKIADYPFTTLSPNLGVLRAEDRDIVIADIPGLIEGAHEGVGLGEDFLRHVERTRLLVHVVDVSREDPMADIAVIDAEIAAYGKGLEKRDRLFALNKIDLEGARMRGRALADGLGASAHLVSAATGDGVPELVRAIVAVCPPRELARAAEVPERRIELKRTARDWRVERSDGGYRVVGERIERLARGIDWNSPDAAAYFQDLLVRSGIERELRKLGVQEGDSVRVGDLELEWQEGS